MQPSTLEERLRTRGWRMTPQRRAVVWALDSLPGHFSAEEVHDVMQRGGTRISLATVYNTLGALVAMGEIGEVRDGRGPARYDPNIRPHDHLVCDRCGRLFDIEPVDLPAVDLSLARRSGFVVEGVNVVVHGHCRDCASEA